ncbi:MAG: hypothetical protein COA42_16720 [Alteromonadaceae bacterium]|nr:MAG: hypothetical protein COA42_16720 [Alteromonadaceae bacterium]
MTFAPRTTIVKKSLSAIAFVAAFAFSTAQASDMDNASVSHSFELSGGADNSGSANGATSDFQTMINDMNVMLAKKLALQVKSTLDQIASE